MAIRQVSIDSIERKRVLKVRLFQGKQKTLTHTRLVKIKVVKGAPIQLNI